MMRRCISVLSLLLLSTTSAHAQTRVEVIKPVSAALTQRLTLSGSVTSPLDATLSTQLSGLIQSVLVDAGDRVDANQPLLRLETTLAELSLRSEAAALREAEIQLEEAQRLENEARPLAERGSLPQSDYAARRAATESAGAVVARLQARHAELAERVDRHTLRAPFAGVIRRRHASPGEWVNPADPVLELVAVDNLRIDVRAPQQRYRDLLVAGPVQVRFDALPQRMFDGKIATRVPALEPEARSFLIRVTLNDVAAPVAPGMSARVTFALPADASTLSIPRDALLRFPDGSNIVWIVDGDGTARRRQVMLEELNGSQALIREGLSPDDRVVIRGNETLREGQAVIARPYQPS